MKASEKKRFIRELCASIQKTALDAVAKMPEEWDGLELRRYLAEKFQNSVWPMVRSESRAYNNEVIVRNL